MTKNTDMPSIRQKIEQRMARAQERRRKAALTWLGLAGLAYDASQAALEAIGDLFDKAQQRGEQVEEDVNARITQFQDKVAGKVKTRRRRFEERIDSLADDVSQRGQEVEQKLKETLSSLKPAPSEQDQAEDQRIEIEVEVVEQPPLPGYGDLTVPDVVQRIAELSPHALKAVRVYESAHKNRVTVLREIDRCLAQSEQAEPSA